MLCLNLRKEWAEEPRAIAAQLERQAWCLDRARQAEWLVVHAHETRGPGGPISRGPLRGLAPLACEPVFVVADRVFGNDTLLDAFCARATRQLFVIGIGRSAAWSPCGDCKVRVVCDAFVELGAGVGGFARVESVEVFADASAKIVAIEAWRLARGSGEAN